MLQIGTWLTLSELKDVGSLCRRLKVTLMFHMPQDTNLIKLSNWPIYLSNLLNYIFRNFAPKSMWSAGSKNDLPLFWGPKKEKPHISAQGGPRPKIFGAIIRGG